VLQISPGGGIGCHRRKAGLGKRSFAKKSRGKKKGGGGEEKFPMERDLFFVEKRRDLSLGREGGEKNRGPVEAYGAASVRAPNGA